MGDNTASKTIILKISDGQEFEIPEAVAKVSPTLCGIIEDDCADAKGFILLPEYITATTLAKVIEYCEKHAAATDASETKSEMVSGEDLKNWNGYFADVRPTMLFHLGRAANYLKIKELENLTIQKAADIIKGKSPEEIRKTFKIINDFTREEEEEIRREFQWAFR